jgi:exopolysaccharide biosynthesis polyprenyl glycosylphosphotransferase
MEGLLRAGKAAVVAAGSYVMIPVLAPPLPTSRITVIIFVVLTTGAVVASRALYAAVFAHPAFRQRVLVLGTGAAAQTIEHAIREFGNSEFDLVGMLDPHADAAGSGAGSAVLRYPQHLLAVIFRSRVSRVVVAVDGGRIDDSTAAVLLACHERGIAISPMDALYEELTGRVPVSYTTRDLQFVIALQSRRSLVFDLVKRSMDLAIGCVGLLLMLLLLPVVLLDLAMEAPGPLFYRQRRTGLGGKEFTLLKFRTMVPDAERDTGPTWADEDDPRVTRLGRVLRCLHLDEVPQALNLLRGEMSFIGPRPERPEFISALERQIPLYRARHAVKPGITGWAQVNHGYGASVEDAFRKLQYDLFYIKHRSIWTEVVILARTLVLVLSFKGR